MTFFNLEFSTHVKQSSRRTEQSCLVMRGLSNWVFFWWYWGGNLGLEHARCSTTEAPPSALFFLYVLR